MKIELNSGIYLIVNRINGKLYVGSTRNFSSRRASHFSELRLKRHGNLILQRAFNKYGEDAFDFVVLERCPEAKLRVRELQWIEALKAYKTQKGYNILRPDEERFVPSPAMLLARSARMKQWHAEHPRHQAVMVERAREAVLGTRFSAQHRARISAALKGLPSALRGRKRSAEAVQKTIETKRRTGKLKTTEATKAKLSRIQRLRLAALTAAERKQITAAARAANRGRKLTPAHRRALSESKKKYWADWRRQRGLT